MVHCLLDGWLLQCPSNNEGLLQLVLHLAAAGDPVNVVAFVSQFVHRGLSNDSTEGVYALSDFTESLQQMNLLVNMYHRSVDSLGSSFPTL